jgi:hypothetical protein
MTERLQLSEILAAVDTNTRELWDVAGEDQQKVIQGDLFRLNRYISNVQRGNRETKEHFVLTVNEYFNKNWHVLSKHPKLLWLLICMCSLDGNTVMYHEWIGLKKKDTKSSNSKLKFLEELYPSMKLDEVYMLADIMTDNDFKELAISHGYTDNDIKKLLK